MYIFFMISGYLFVVGFSIIINFLFELFSINKVTKFLSPLEDTIFNKIGVIIIPNIIWALIEVIMLGSNKLFIFGFLLNLFVSLSVMYVIKYGYLLISKFESNIVDVVSIFFSTFFGFACNYICLLIGTNYKVDTFISVIGLLLFLVFYFIIRFFPPNSEFFRGSAKQK